MEAVKILGRDCRRHERREEDQRPLGEGLSKEREAKQGVRAGMWPRQWHETGGVEQKM